MKRNLKLFSLVVIFTIVELFATNACSGQTSCCEQYDDRPLFVFMDDFRCDRHDRPKRDPWGERIETERHDFTQSTKTVGKGVTQIESGYSYFYKDQDDEIEQTHVTPEMLVRLGLTEDIEFRLRFNYGWKFIDIANDLSGTQDLILSLKLGITEESCLTPESALEIRWSAPTGGSDYSTGRVDHGLDYIYCWELSEGIELYGSTGYGTGGLDDVSLIPEEPADDWFIVWSQSVALGAELTDRVTMYNEFFGLFSHALADDFSIVVYNIGFDYYITDDLVFDIRAGKGLTGDSDDFFFGIGGGLRL